MPGAFVIRNSGSFMNALGLALRVERSSSEPPSYPTDPAQPNIPVRHYLIESLSQMPAAAEPMLRNPPIGISPAQLPPRLPSRLSKSAINVYDSLVRFKGCLNEPIFTNLVSLLYEHCVQPLSLPTKLRLPFDHATTLPSLIASQNPANLVQRLHVQRGPALPAMQGRTNSVYSLYQGNNCSNRNNADFLMAPRPPSSDPIPSRTTMRLQHQPHSFENHRQKPFGSNHPMHTGSFDKPSHPISRSNVVRALYLGSIDMEMDFGDRAMYRAVNVLLENAAQVKQTETSIEIRADGITVTDSWRKLFFRRHYPSHYVVYCGVDPEDRCWDSAECRSLGLTQPRIFGFLAKKQNSQENMCHLFCEMPEFSAFYVIDQMNRAILSSTR
ncbi:Tensin 1 [Cichlidogyrus casuarinus]|uniref:Tensin 1 n=1 Tax=Cichlidogyrus casuarinus TaxID=1844966 RepID=A0ABD2PNQ8_9PLAT